MKTHELINEWFTKWESGDFLNLPISENFKHTSPFGIIEGKTDYLDIVSDNRDKFLGYSFIIHDILVDEKKACTRYTAVQNDFSLDVSEWYIVSENLIEEIVAYYHIGEIRKERQLDK